MIVELAVENLAIIEAAQLRPSPALTVLSGETGAGKSLVIDAIELALGDRADSNLVRTGSGRAAVDLTLEFEANSPVWLALGALGIESDQNRLFISREVFAEGRSSCRINGKLAPVATLKKIGELIVDLHGQHDHQSLLDPARHLELLDAWIGERVATMKSVVQDRFEAHGHVAKLIAMATTGRREREARMDLLSFQVDEINAVAPQPGESERVENALSKLRNLDRLRIAAAAALDRLADAEDSVDDHLAEAAQGIREASRLDQTLDDSADSLEQSLALLREATHSLRNYLDSLDIEPDALEIAAARLDSLKRLRRKYGDTDTEVVAYADAARAELDGLRELELDESALQAKEELARRALEEAAEALSRTRQDGRGRFASEVLAELAELGMAKAEFEAEFERGPITALGGDKVEFLFSANPGERPRPLARIASGGELSRVMLAIKTALAGKAGVPILIFDEIDAGLGGQAAKAVAQMLRKLSRQYQVIAISHLAQIAAAADIHIQIEKESTGGRTVTRLLELNREARISEMARMLAGNADSAAARQAAQELRAPFL